MRKSIDIYWNFQTSALGGKKLPHSTSYPTIYHRDGKVYLATFTYLFMPIDLSKGLIERPSFWSIADIETGEIIKEFNCRTDDFSNEPFNKRYSTDLGDDFDLSDEFIETAMDKLDKIRSDFLSKGQYNEMDYAEYLEQILKNVPYSYQQFYIELSI